MHRTDPEGLTALSTDRTGPQAGALTLTSRTEPDGSIVCRLSGELDLDSLSAAKVVFAQHLEARPARLLVDLEELTFCDSSGLNLLIKTRQAAQEAGVDLRLGTLSAQVERLLAITGAGEVFTVLPTGAGAPPTTLDETLD